MPSRNIHIAVGTPAGLLFAVHKSHGQNDLTRIVEAGGGLFGGLLGALAPDLIDPPTSPCHRSVGHGLLPVAACAAAWTLSLNAWQSELRRMADLQRVLAIQCADPVAKLWYALIETVLRLLAGIVAGLLAGYLSHVALDFCTPGCLPLVS
jgi:hypothetical protein